MIVWVVGRNYPSHENNMQGSFELEQAKMLSRYGNQVYYLASSFHPAKRIRGKGIQVWTDDNIEINTLSAFFAPRVYPVYLVKLRNKLWEILFGDVVRRHGLPDVIHLHFPAMLMVADVLSKYHSKGVRIIVTEHWSKVLNKDLDSIEKKEYKKIGEVTDHFICVGKPLANAVSDMIDIKPLVIPNVVNKVFGPCEEYHEGFRYVAVGRLIKIKQFDRIIKAFAECFAGASNITLTIIGGGVEKDNLIKLVLENNLTNQVMILGNLNRESTAEVVSNSDCLICNSRFETFGVPIIEAWACGIPVISTTAAAVTDIFDERLGLEISPNDYEGLIQAIKYIYNNRERYDKQFIVDYAMDHFSEDIIAQKLMDLYKT